MIEPTVLIIFGATGDLARRKLYPAFFDLFVKGLLPKKFAVLAFGRREFTDTSYREFVSEALGERLTKASVELSQKFLSGIHYVQGQFEDNQAYERLSERLGAIDREFNVCSNKLPYLAVPPNLYELILRQLARSGLTIPCADGKGWTRILIEKPFGKDSETATRLDRLLTKLFSENQIYRIDHYLAKETIQNILTFRFSNAIFEPLWNRKNIERIEIRMFEKDHIGSRGAFYDSIGTLRDVGQNHLLAMLSLIMMEYPKTLDAVHIRKVRARVLKQLVAVSGPALRKVIRGQYAGYRQAAGVGVASDTETFFSLTTGIRNSRWRGVSVELSAGKALSETKTEINIHFKDVDCGIGDVKCNRNMLTFRIQPNEGISIVFWVKRPGFDMVPQAQTLSFNYADSIDAHLMPDAYERVLIDALRGDQMLFASTEETEAAWKFITPIIERWTKNKLLEYPEGISFEQLIAKS
ncbi:MAG: glucose-6-phosphate dehydrogenase [Candidatus Taylorbacteria bacterium RIFCSPHIGHO2_01_FULL_46_22b]|uniref:Glucose-6-phosphate 1-dehydrogenase n=1 Tax=Candidatus Taylorbacteria bacterium RIFCSPHIGHO2_01_FULL_46_22b TaxID=1802301 RepID=A0A1G2M1B6_9BACT|nr:MAG: glucose-6-phosphate dehydrogenase [Candidatus Taylorbacteria bacterium RIFCSPHIGHO2_01_FULL_46_22b]